jgi:hypothetical protein
MRAWKSVAALALLGLSSCLVEAMPTAENLHKMMAESGHIDKRCPFASISDEPQDDLAKRFLLKSMKSPIDGKSVESD